MNQNTQETLEEFAAVIRDLSVVAVHIAQVEEAKAAAASARRHELLDGYIQDEQAQILKLRGLEQRRLKLMDTLGWKSFTFRQILEKATSEQEHLLRPLFLELEQHLKRLEHARKSSEQIINARLREMNLIMARQQGRSYDNTGALNAGSPVRTKLQDKYV